MTKSYIFRNNLWKW